MPLPRQSERAATRIQGIVAGFDADLADYIATGGRPPSIGRIMTELEPLVVASVTAALLQVDPDVSPQVLADAVNVQLAAIQQALTVAVRDARTARRRVPRRLPESDDDEPVAALVRRVGPVVAFAVLVAALPARTKARARKVRRLGQATHAKLPRPTAAHARMIVRTETAIGRNRHAADIAVRDDKVIAVRDALKGPTDAECERVDGRYATPEWMRRNLVAHPHCTREGRPVNLPAGQSVTLLE